MSKKAGVKFGVATALGLILMGCNGSGNSSDNSTTPSSNPPPAGQPVTPPAPGAKPADATAASTTMDGATLFSQNCAKCHGEKGVNGRAPTLAGKETSISQVVVVITMGKKRMPAFKGRLSDAQIQSVAKYVTSL